jgi:hypothetical protein
LGQALTRSGARRALRATSSRGIELVMVATASSQARSSGERGGASLSNLTIHVQQQPAAVRRPYAIVFLRYEHFLHECSRRAYLILLNFRREAIEYALPAPLNVTGLLLFSHEPIAKPSGQVALQGWQSAIYSIHI